MSKKKPRKPKYTGLTVAAAAAQFPCGIQHVLKLIHTNQLPAANISTGSCRPRWSISEDDLQDFIKSRLNLKQPDEATTERPTSAPPREYV